MELDKECPECEGGGFIAKLYPNGHTEVFCEACNGSGVVEEDEILLHTTKYSNPRYKEYTLIMTQEVQQDIYFSYRYCVFWHPQVGGQEHIIQAGSGSSNANEPIGNKEKLQLLERAINLKAKGIRKPNKPIS